MKKYLPHLISCILVLSATALLALGSRHSETHYMGLEGWYHNYGFPLVFLQVNPEGEISYVDGKLLAFNLLVVLAINAVMVVGKLSAGMRLSQNILLLLLMCAWTAAFLLPWTNRQPWLQLWLGALFVWLAWIWIVAAYLFQNRKRRRIDRST